jgi:hypothetical protein
MCLQPACEFFDVPFDDGAYQKWIDTMKDASADAHPHNAKTS